MSSVYLSSTKGEHFSTARQDLVTMLVDFQEQMEAANIRPNITQVIDNHLVRGIATPYASVGMTDVDMSGAEFGYLSRSGSVFEMRAELQMEIWIHLCPQDGQYDERLKWNLLNSLFNYLKDRGTVSTNFDAMFLRRIQGNVAFGATGTEGAVFNLTLTKVAST